MWSARYAGEDATDEENLAKLLREVPADGDRAVAYVCAMAYVEPGGREEVVHGRCEGTLDPRAARQRRLRLRPRVRPRRLSRRRAHDGRARRRDEKDAISHRGRAARALAIRLARAEEERRSPRGAVRRPAAREPRVTRRRRARAQRTALASVAAAVLLVAVKLVTGLVTGSLAFVAEAAHSGTDLVAALLTLFAVRVAVRPPDREHHYGHGKAEHLAALGESAFLIARVGGIADESLRRLTGDGGTTWTSRGGRSSSSRRDRASTPRARSRACGRRGTRGSAALAANAVHFASDLAGSLAVLVGLLFVRAGHQARTPWPRCSSPSSWSSRRCGWPRGRSTC